MKTMRRTFAAMTAGAILATGLAIDAGPTLAQGKVLRFVQNGNLTILDRSGRRPTSRATRLPDLRHALCSDENNAVKPQMVDKYEVSPDKTVWTFTLRDGLEWHDGKPVTSEDCIASIQRWASATRWHQAHGLHQGLQGGRRQDLPDRAKEPYGLVLDSLASVLERALHDAKAVAETDAFKQIDRRSDRAPSSTRRTSPSPARSTSISRTQVQAALGAGLGLAGGKIAKVDRVEIVEMPDVQQQVNALIAARSTWSSSRRTTSAGAEGRQERGPRGLEPLGHVFVIRFNHV